MDIFIEDLIPENFDAFFLDALDHNHTFYTAYGGRGSSKSSVISLLIPLILKSNKNYNAVIVRRRMNTLRDSVYAQILWAISTLGMDRLFTATVSPMQITYKPTGQQILFRGMDDPVKLKSLKFRKGYCAICWFEESAEMTPESIRSVQQSVMRGGSDFWIFDSFNPPISKKNWKNKDVLIDKPNRLLHHSDYRTVPVEWLSKAFIDEAEYLKDTNLRFYNNEYLGIVTGTGDNVFENLTIRQISNEEIAPWEWIYMGMDFGWYPDPLAWTKMYYNPKDNKLYIFDEYVVNKQRNHDVWEHLMENKGVADNDRIMADNAPKDIADFRSYGSSMRAAEKGPGTVEYSVKWLQSLSEIVIDNRRCPVSATEFTDYEYEKDKDGEVISGYVDKNNHCIDSVRYALSAVWRRKGQ